jgi:hypothetical protein
MSSLPWNSSGGGLPATALLPGPQDLLGKRQQTKLHPLEPVKVVIQGQPSTAARNQLSFPALGLQMSQLLGAAPEALASDELMTIAEQAQAYQQIAEGYAKLAKMKLVNDGYGTPFGESYTKIKNTLRL